MGTVWFALAAFMLTVYVVLDGFDLGAGIAHLFVARTEEDRRRVLASIGPFWDGNEVWLLASGGTLVFAFPTLYASSFSGFFLPLTVVLWLLMGRGIAIEFRHHIEAPVWRPFWDAIFALSSGLLALFFGTALGNVVRGVPLDASGVFFEAFFTDFRLGAEVGIIDWYTLLVGLVAFGSLAMHGSLWLGMKTDGELGRRARDFARLCWWVTAVLTTIVSVATFNVQPQIARQIGAHPWGLIFPAAGFAGLVGARIYVGGPGERAAKAFLASCLFLGGMLAATAFGLYPFVLPSNLDPALGLSIYNSAASDEGLRKALIWWIPGTLLAGTYSIFVYSHFAGRAGDAYGPED